ncbi:MAG: PqiC family protein [Cellvibrionaceae bacterium]
MTSARSILMLFAFSLLLFGCTTAPTPRYYLLDSGFESVVQKNYKKVSRVRLPSYLQTGSLVLQIGPQELRVASFHFWAESLEQGFARAFDVAFNEVEIDFTQAIEDLKIVIDVKRFHGDLDGEVSLVADWKSISNCGSQQGGFSHTIVQSESGYPSLVAAQVNLVELMAKDVKQVLSQNSCREYPALESGA